MSETEQILKEIKNQKHYWFELFKTACEREGMVSIQCRLSQFSQNTFSLFDEKTQIGFRLADYIDSYSLAVFHGNYHITYRITKDEFLSLKAELKGT